MQNSYFDLNIPWASASPKLIARLLDCGYTCFCFTCDVNLDEFSFSESTAEIRADSKGGEACGKGSTRKKNKDERLKMRQSFELALAPPRHDDILRMLAEADKYRILLSVEPKRLPPRCFTRANLVCGDPILGSHFFREYSKRLIEFDIVSFLPTSSQAFSYACETAPGIDLLVIDISINSFGSFPSRISNKQLCMLASRGVPIELNYASLLKPTNNAIVTAQANLASVLTNLMKVCRRSLDNMLVISSCASQISQIRRPLAVICLFASLGLKQHQQALHSALTVNPLAVITHGLSRGQTTVGLAAHLRLLDDPRVVHIEQSIANTSTKNSIINGTNKEITFKKRIEVRDDSFSTDSNDKIVSHNTTAKKIKHSSD